MSLLGLVPHIALVLALFYKHDSLISAQIHNDVSELKTEDEVICPNAEDISPCNCSVVNGIFGPNFGRYIDLTCIGIADEQQLYDIFHSEIPNHTFRKFTLRTTNIKSLSADVFGDATFENFYAWGGILSSIHPETLIKSASTLKHVDLEANRLTEFPFETLSNYTKLIDFHMNENPLESFPKIESETIRTLFLCIVPYTFIPDGALDGLPNLWAFRSYATGVTQIPTGLFASLSKVREINVDSNDLGHLTSGQFEVSSSFVMIELLGCNLTTIDPETFKGMHSGFIGLDYNELTVLPEETWRPLLDAGVTLHISNNPLTCGCDAAWLVLEPSYHELVVDAWCAEGPDLLDRDPSWYEDNC